MMQLRARKEKHVCTSMSMIITNTAQFHAASNLGKRGTRNFQIYHNGDTLCNRDQIQLQSLHREYPVIILKQ